MIEVTATCGLLLGAPDWHFRGTQAVGEVQESLVGIRWFVKLNFVREGIHSGAFICPWGNHSLLLLCYGCFVFKFHILDLI